MPKGADLGKKLVARTHDGIEIQPLYPKAEGLRRWCASRPGAGACQADRPSEPAKANELALLDLEGGADALNLIFAGAPSARGFGVGIDILSRTSTGRSPA